MSVAGGGDRCGFKSSSSRFFFKKKWGWPYSAARADCVARAKNPVREKKEERRGGARAFAEVLGEKRHFLSLSPPVSGLFFWPPSN